MNDSIDIVNIKKDKLKIAGKLFLGIFWKIFIVISIIITVLGAFTDFTFIRSYPYQIGFILLVITSTLSLIMIISRLISENIVNRNKIDLPKEIERTAKLLYANKDYIELVRYGSQISRFLWLGGHNNERILVGKLVEDSASKIGRKQEQIAALIDDIGWTYFVTGDKEEARKNITNGIEKAVKENLYYYAAKGERHLAGIESSDGNKDGILKHLNNAQEYTKKIRDKGKKDEMEASLFLAKAEYFYENENYTEAESNAKLAKDVFVSDLDRIVKVYSLLGNIYLSQNEYQKAKDEFNQGYNKCQKIRKDELAKNAVGLAKIELNSNNLEIAKNYLNEAKNILSTSSKHHELVEVNKLLQSIENST